jgi:hypothetical protein
MWLEHGAAPVKVVAVRPNWFTFKAILWHPEGAGRKIEFRFFPPHGLHIHMNVHAWGEGSLPVLVDPPGSWLNFKFAHWLWHRFAENIKATYDWNLQDGGSGGPPM